MAGKSLKTSVKSTATIKTVKPSTAKASTASKAAALKAAASKNASEKKSDSKKTVKSVPAPVKTKTAAKSVSKPKAACDVKSKSSPAKKAAVKTTVKPAAKLEKTSAAALTKKSQKKTVLKTDDAPKAEAKKTVKSGTPKPEKTTAVKKTVKTAKPVQTLTVAKPVKKSGAVKTTPTQKNGESDTVSKKTQSANMTIKKQEEPVSEPEQTSKPKTKRISKFMTKANAAIIAKLRQQLIERRNEILSFYWGDLGSANVSSQASGDTADAATDSVHSEMRSQLAEKESQELTDINNALHKMETGEYGLCEECGMPIPIERLEAIPDAELCLKCQEELEEDGDYDNYSYYGYD